MMGVHGIRNMYYPHPLDEKLYNPSRTKLSMFKWVGEQQQLTFDHSLKIENKLLQKCYYAEHLDMLVVMCENKEIEALEFRSLETVWQLPGVVDGRTVKPDAITSDKSGKCLHR